MFYFHQFNNAQASVQDLATIQEQLTSEVLFEAFKQQLTKDFEQSNFPTVFIASLLPDYQKLVEKITYELQRSKKNADTHLSQLLYRVDISETKLRKYLHEQQDEDPLHVMAQLIVKRILQKVVIRKFYRGRSYRSWILDTRFRILDSHCISAIINQCH